MATQDPSFIGFGEAAMAFAGGLSASGYDRKLADPVTRAAKLADFVALKAEAAMTNRAAVAGKAVILSLVTADQARAAAEETALSIAPGALFCDLNSLAPETKRHAAQAIEQAGGRYVDVAVMAPVHPLGRKVPLLVAGPHAEAGAAALTAIGFTNVRIVSASIGAASAIKMIRSVMVKGLEALTAECLLAAEAAGVRDEVLASLDASERARPWAERGAYNLDRMIVHGGRRAEEMVEVVKTLDALGTGSAMARATTERQRAIGALGVAPTDTLDFTLALLNARLSPAVGFAA
jgi:3-hydroxyisobutyrate dehydrogenase-like beta-hydroxyacid dehydrogenase